MAFESENGAGMVMPVQPMYGGGYGGGYGYPVPVYGGNYGNNGLFGGGGDLGALLVLFLFGALFGGGGFGGFGMGGWGGIGGMMGGANLMMWPWLMTQNTDNIVQGGFNNSAVQGQLSGIQSGMTSGFGDVQLGISSLGRQICETGGNITSAINGAASAAEIAAQGRHSALTQQLYNNEIGSLNRSFAEQQANQQGFTSVTRQLSDCCCENRLATEGLRSTILSENCADRAAVTEGVRDLLTAGTSNTQNILNAVRGIYDQMCQDKIDAKNEKIADLERQLTMANLAASQTAQTAAIQAGQRALANEVETYVRPPINPSYNVPNPYAGSGYGWCGGCCGNAA